MPWLYLTLLNVLGTAIANIFRRITMKDGQGDAVASSVANQFIGAIVLQERDHLWRKVFCTILVTIGVILLS